jgi:hypothetical protein
VVLAPSQGWKLALAAALLAAILLSACARAPRRAVAGSDLRRLVVAALVLYAAGVFAASRHYPVLSALAYAAGIGICALAAWLSRGIDSEDPPGGGDGGEWPRWPPSDPEGASGRGWDAFERDFRAHVERQGEPSALP